MQFRESLGGYYELCWAVEHHHVEARRITAGQQLWYFIHSSLLDRVTFEDIVRAYGKLTQTPFYPHDTQRRTSC